MKYIKAFLNMNKEYKSSWMTAFISYMISVGISSFLFTAAALSLSQEILLIAVVIMTIGPTIPFYKISYKTAKQLTKSFLPIVGLTIAYQLIYVICNSVFTYGLLYLAIQLL